MRLPWVGKTYATLAPMTRAEQLIAAVQQSGFPYLDSLIHLFVGGSELHGATVKDTDDLRDELVHSILRGGWWRFLLCFLCSGKLRLRNLRGLDAVTLELLVLVGD